MKFLLNLFLGVTTLLYLCMAAGAAKSNNDTTKKAGTFCSVLGLTGGSLLLVSLLGMI